MARDRAGGVRARRGARRLAAALALLAGACAPPAAAAAKAGRIVSMNLCTDLLLLQLVPKARIRSVSFLAHPAVLSVEPGLDDGIAINHGAAEDVAMQAPDLILAGAYSTPVTKRLARRVGVPIVETAAPESFEEIRAFTRQVARAVGEPARGEALLAEMDRKLAWLRAHPPARRYTVAAWSGGAVPGRRTLADALIEAAGGVNIAARLDSARYSTFGVEELLRARPDILIQGDGEDKDLSLHTLGPLHPLVRRVWAGRTITYPSILFTCGLPQSVDAALQLRGAFDRIGRLPQAAAR